MDSVYPEQDRSEWIVAQRPPRNVLDPYRPHGFFLEREPSRSGRVVSSAVILLTNKECPWRCVMCDLWKNTLPYSVPSGAIPGQIEYALHRLDSPPQQIKLYNSGSFFDSAAIPVGDYPAIAEKVSFAERVIVESHPRLVGEKAVLFRDLLIGAQSSSSARQNQGDKTTSRAELELCAPRLEVALGLETIHARILPRLNKQFDRADFHDAARSLYRAGIDLRVFVLIKPPFMNESLAVEWAIKSTEFAFTCGASVVSLIPTRGGNGAMERLMESHEFAPPRLDTVERALEECLARFCTPRRSSTAAADSSMRNSPSPQPFPLGRGSKVAQACGDHDCPDSGRGSKWFSLSPRERVGVRGNEIGELDLSSASPIAAKLPAGAGHLRRRIFVDTWNLEQFSTCPHCFEQRRLRLCQMNLSQAILPAISCSFCKGL